MLLRDIYYHTHCYHKVGEVNSCSFCIRAMNINPNDEFIFLEEINRHLTTDWKNNLSLMNIPNKILISLLDIELVIDNHFKEAYSDVLDDKEHLLRTQVEKLFHQTIEREEKMFHERYAGLNDQDTDSDG